jgi:thiamine-phosphate pyrophosphorylase
VSLPNPTRKSPLICYVTDRRAFSVSTSSQEEQCAGLVARIAAAVAAGVDWIQIREKDLDGARLAELTRPVLAQVNPQCRILINDRLDVAYAVGAAGVHLGERSISVADARSFIRQKNNSQTFSIGASVHSLEAAQRAESDGADYVIFGPVFATPSKLSIGAPQGLERLEAICSAIKIPVLAIGGITVETALQCYARGAAGIAGIRIFQEQPKLESLVAQLRRF